MNVQQIFLATLGSAGIGLVWGWLIGGLQKRAYRFKRTKLALSTTTLLFVAEVVFFFGLHLLPYFVGATAVALLLRRVWHRLWDHRIDPSF